MKSVSMLYLICLLLITLSALQCSAQNFTLTGSQHLNVTASYDKGVLFQSSTAYVSSPGHISEAKLFDNSALAIASGSIGTVSAYGYSTLTINGGRFSQQSAVCASDYSTLTISGGEFEQPSAVKAVGIGPVNITGGNFINTEAVTAGNYGNVNISGGNYTHINAVRAQAGGTVNITGGSFTERNAAIAYDKGTVNISGGNYYAEYAVGAAIGGIMNITGGSFAHAVSSSGTGIVNISGGEVPAVHGVFYQGRIVFYGTDFRALNGLTLMQDGLLGGIRVRGTGTLTGKWYDGTEWSTEILTNNGIIQIVPEPSGLLSLLGGVGVLGAALRRRKQ